MKKTLVAAITSALVIGAASTTFAAANPFSDVPTDHWSYDAVAKLAHEGVIEGYGDNTFRGDAKITRYEMAQMVAKAMAKEGVSSSNKATIDKLSAEYADELNNLGVRVSALEKKTDNVKFTGFLRLDGTHTEIDSHDDGSEATGTIRLDMNAAVNDDWAVKARFESEADLDNDSSDRDTELKQAYAEGPLFGANAKLGKFGTFDAEHLTNGGLIMDTEVSGAEFQFGKALKTIVTVGRLHGDNYSANDEVKRLTNTDANLYGTSDYAAIQFGYDATNKLSLGAGYYNLRNSVGFLDGEGVDDTNSIWNLGFDYKFNNNLTFGGLYAQSSLDAAEGTNDDNEDAYSVQLTYKGAESNAPGSFGAWVAYRQIGSFASVAPTYDGVGFAEKGTEVGVDYMLDKNILAKLVYFDGEKINGENDVEKVFGRIEFQF
ncbi:S-layer homology domain-containing protein [Anaerosinus massiliensis]|uniref:S-layer homology domain-containing protein n=1 Tax=Massilibacillus massiliensis TaxID=1806837 RepID=UPI000A7B8A24|nr:S-layer homology domain-containing protein [Massilibacillus massiliensis]